MGWWKDRIIEAFEELEGEYDNEDEAWAAAEERAVERLANAVDRAREAAKDGRQ